ncbi:MAG: hypothetical protein ACXABY_28435 [Candidatus Thorarchaeota archaeon]
MPIKDPDKEVKEDLAKPFWTLMDSDDIDYCAALLTSAKVDEALTMSADLQPAAHHRYTCSMITTGVIRSIAALSDTEHELDPEIDYDIMADIIKERAKMLDLMVPLYAGVKKEAVHLGGVEDALVAITHFIPRKK